MAGKPKLQPLPKKLSDDPGRTGSGKSDIVAASGADSRKQRDGSNKALITPRRMALKISSQTIVIEYKEQETGKLRHRTFRIDKARFESADACQKKLWRRLSKAVVPGSLKEEQLERLVAKLFAPSKHESTGEFDDDDLDAATDRLLAQQVELPAPTPSAHSAAQPKPASSPPSNDDAAKEDEDDATPDNAPSSLGSLGSLSGLPSLKGRGDGGLLKPLAPVSMGIPAASGRGGSDDSDEDGDEGLSAAKPSSKKEEKADAKPAESPASAAQEEEDVEEEIEYASDFEDIDVAESPKPADSGGGEAKSENGEDAADEMPEEERQDILRKIQSGEIDLQKVAPDELALYKRLMDIEFKKNAKRPGDEGYLHDVQVEFEEPEEDAGWDEDDDYVASDDDF